MSWLDDVKRRIREEDRAKVLALIDRVRASDRTDVKAAEALLREFCKRGSGGDPLTGYFIEAFQEIWTGGDPKSALGLNSGPGRPEDPDLPRRNLEIAVKIHQRKRRLSHNKAIESVAKEYNVSPVTARDAWRARKAEAESIRAEAERLSTLTQEIFGSVPSSEQGEESI